MICRYIIHGITVDVMPPSEEILGFSNQWYSKAFAHSTSVALEDGLSIRIFIAPYFLATKLEAFVDRGENEGRFSSDFEDIIHVLNNRQSIWEEIGNADEPVKQYLKDQLMCHTSILTALYNDEKIKAEV